MRRNLFGKLISRNNAHACGAMRVAWEIMRRWRLGPGVVAGGYRTGRQQLCWGGFTLLELLVVVVIIALLAGLLLPVLSGVKAKARSVVCLSHVRQWGMAMWMYGEEEEEYFPYEGNFFIPIDTGPNLAAWYNAAAVYAGQSRLIELYEQGLMPVPGRRSLFTCPSVVKPPSRVPSMKWPFFMYGFNNRLDPNGPARFKRPQVVFPDRTVVFTENNESRYPSTAGRYTPARHEGRANLAFVDGHAEGISSNDYRRTRQEDLSSGAEWNLSRVVYWYPYRGASD